MFERRMVAAIYFLILAGTILLVASMEEPNRLLDGIVGAIVAWGTLIIQFYYRKRPDSEKG